jgi:hypothetical protein
MKPCLGGGAPVSRSLLLVLLDASPFFRDRPPPFIAQEEGRSSVASSRSHRAMVKPIVLLGKVVFVRERLGRLVVSYSLWLWGTDIPRVH